MERTDQQGMPAASPPPSPPRALYWLLKLALAAVLGIVFGKLASDLWAGKELVFDRTAMLALHDLASPPLTAAMRVLATSTSGLGIAGVALSLACYWWQRTTQRAEAVVLLSTLATSAALGQRLKVLFARPRPRLFPWLTVPGGWSFPSGHTLTAVVMGSLLAWLIGRRLKGGQRLALWTVAGLWSGLVGLSRVYLGVHYPSDVLASLALGGLCLLAARRSYRAIDAQSPA